MKKIALAHYWFLNWRGGEKVVKSLISHYNIQDIYTLFLDNRIKSKYLIDKNINSSIFNKLSFIRKHHQIFFPLYPIFVKTLKIKDDVDILISSESGPIKGIKKNKHQKHICYVHTPMRYCYGFQKEYLSKYPKILQKLAKLFLLYLKKYDKSTIDNVDLYIANSLNIKNRIKQFYNRESVVIYPPIERNVYLRKIKTNKGKYFLSFGALVPYKRIDLLVDAFNLLGEKLLIVGNGPEFDDLVARSNSNIEFLGSVKDEALDDIISNAKALLFPGEEDFGMIPLEVQAQGVPVIAYSKGGALETVIENLNDSKLSTGIFFKDQNVNSIINAINKFNKIEEEFDPYFIHKHALEFSEAKFIEKFDKVLNEFLNK